MGEHQMYMVSQPGKLTQSRKQEKNSLLDLAIAKNRTTSHDVADRQSIRTPLLPFVSTKTFRTTCSCVSCLTLLKSHPPFEWVSSLLCLNLSLDLIPPRRSVLIDRVTGSERRFCFMACEGNLRRVFKETRRRRQQSG